MRSVHANMTDAERTDWARYSRWFGGFVAGTLALPVSFVVLSRHPAAIAVSTVLLFVFVAALPFWAGASRRRLADTIWARVQGLTAADLTPVLRWRALILLLVVVSGPAAIWAVCFSLCR